MLIGLKRFKESQTILPKLSIILFNLMCYGYIAYVAIFFVMLNIFNYFTIGIAVLVLTNISLVSTSIISFADKKDTHINTFDYFMSSLNISKRSFISEMAEEINSSETLQSGFLAIFLIAVCFMAILLSPYNDGLLALDLIGLMVLVLPILSIINIFFNYKIFNRDEVNPKELAEINNVNDITENEKNLFKEFLLKKINEKGIIQKIDVLNAYEDVMLSKKLRLDEENKIKMKINLEDKIVEAKEKFDFLKIDNREDIDKS